MSDEARKRFEWRLAMRSFLELLAVTGLAVAQPLLDVFGRSTEAFIIHDAGKADIVAFALTVSLGPALALWAIETAVRAVDPPAGQILHVAFVVVLIGLFVLQALKSADVAEGVLLAVLATIAAVLALLAYRRSAVRQALAYLAVGALLFLGVFFFATPVGDLLGDDEVGAVELDQTGEARSVVMIVWDEWSQNSIVNAEGEIDAELYPNLAALAADGGWYRNATTVATATTAAVPAILSGRYPSDGQAPTAADHPENLFTLLASQYDLEASESVTSMCPDSLCSEPFVDDPTASVEAAAAAHAEVERNADSALAGLLGDAVDSWRAMVSLDADAAGPQSIEEDVTAVTTTTTTVDPADTDAAVDEARATGEQDPTSTGGPPTPGGPGGFELPSNVPVLQIESYQALLDSIEADEEPALHFLHIQLPHTPYRFLPDGRAYDPAAFAMTTAVDITGSRGPQPYAAGVDRQRLMLQVGYVDRLVGQLVERLRSTGLYDDTAIVLTSDHGAGFVPGESHRGFDGETLDESLYPDILYVPLIVKAPGIEAGTVSDANVMSVDILPTVADVLGIEVPWAVDGRSLLGTPRDDPEKQFNKVDLSGGPFGGFGGAVELAETQTFDGDAVLAENLARNLDTVLVGDNPGHRLYAIDRDGDLVGTDIADLSEGDAVTATLVVDGGLAAIEAFGPQDEVVPVHVEGLVEGGSAGDLTIAIAVDGVVAAIEPTYADGEVAHRLDAMLDPAALTGRGPHTVRAFVITGRGTNREAHPLPT